jgi:hypothetical protein
MFAESQAGQDVQLGKAYERPSFYGSSRIQAGRTVVRAPEATVFHNIATNLPDLRAACELCDMFP